MASQRLMRGRVTFWLQLASLLITGWLLWRPYWVGHFAHSPIGMLLRAAAFATVACIAAGLITLVLYLLMRQDPEYVALGPLSTSTAAIWFAPAVILFAERSPAAIVAALALVVTATRVLYDQWQLSLVAAGEEVPPELFSRYWTPTPSFWRLLAPALTGSFFVQIGLAAWLLRESALAGLSLALGAATITVFAQKSHATEFRRPPNLPRSVLGLMLTMVLAIGLTVGGLLPRFGGHGFGSAGDGGTATAPSVANNEPPGHLPPEIPHGTADSGFFGVILWPEVKPYATLIEPMPQGRGGRGTAMPQRPWSIPFSGEYWMYRWPFAHPPQNSYFQRGTPAELSFSTTDHRPMQMEARHKLDQPVAVDCCSSIQVEVRNADQFPGTNALELYLIDRESPRQFQMWVGRVPLKSQPAVSGDHAVPVRETLEFPMPAFTPIQQFDEFRLVFWRASNRANRSAKIAIERMVLIPK
jgi:hypothetical protein